MVQVEAAVSLVIRQQMVGLLNFPLLYDGSLEDQKVEEYHENLRSKESPSELGFVAFIINAEEALNQRFEVVAIY